MSFHYSTNHPSIMYASPGQSLSYLSCYLQMPWIYCSISEKTRRSRIPLSISNIMKRLLVLYASPLRSLPCLPCYLRAPKIGVFTLDSPSRLRISPSFSYRVKYLSVAYASPYLIPAYLPWRTYKSDSADDEEGERFSMRSNILLVFQPFFVFSLRIEHRFRPQQGTHL